MDRATDFAGLAVMLVSEPTNCQRSFIWMIASKYNLYWNKVLNNLFEFHSVFWKIHDDICIDDVKAIVNKTASMNWLVFYPATQRLEKKKKIKNVLEKT